MGERPLKVYCSECQQRYLLGLHSQCPSCGSPKWSLLSREQMQAHVAVHKAVKAGTLKPQPCQECGSNKTQAHHPDYSRPLDVEWLCAKHHRARHRSEKGREGTDWSA
jgi:rRNA maturation protein Nop10